MASDRFIFWKNQKPEKPQFEQMLRDYLGEGLGTVRWDNEGGRWYLSLNGTCSSPLIHLDPTHHTVQALLSEPPRERWIEVHWGENNIDIITRAQDRVTNAIADDLEIFCLRYWHARDTH